MGFAELLEQMADPVWLGEIHAAESSISVQVQPGPDFDWWPKAGQVLTLVACYEPGVFAFGPPGWTQAAHEDRVLWKGREVAATLWWLQLQRDYDGWRYGTEPTPGIDQFELPAVMFSRPNTAEVDFSVWDGVSLPTRVDTGTAIALLEPFTRPS